VISTQNDQKLFIGRDAKGGKGKSQEIKAQGYRGGEVTRFHIGTSFPHFQTHLMHTSGDR